MMYRAFLSHSSTDKEFVRAVANELGRQFCLFDEQVFQNGEEFKNAIEDMLDDSSVFILFISEIALSRIWVKFEIDEAWYRKLEGKISKSLVFLLTKSIQFEQIPKWLSRGKISHANAPKATAREIRHHLEELLRGKQQPYFEGRSQDIADIQKILTPLGQRPPRILGVYGLPNVGRKTFIKKVAQLSLSYPKTLEIPVAEGDTLADVSIKLANQLEPFSTKEGFDFIVKSIRQQTEDELLKRGIANLLAAISHKELPILVDEGGLLNPDGALTDSIRKLITQAEVLDEIYLFLVSNRKPPAQIPSLHLRPLTTDDTQRLISKIAESEKIKVSTDQIREISEYVNGYPPCAYYAVDQAKHYGIQSVILDKNRLIQFRTNAFVKFLKDKQLNKIQQSILLVLARYSPIPAQVLAISLDLNDETLIENLICLIDHSLVMPDSNGLYDIAAPVSEAVVNQFRDDEMVSHEKIFHALKDLLDQHNEDLPRLQLHRQLLKAALRTGSHKEDIFHLTSDLINFAVDFYHRREYKQCIETARLAVAELPTTVTGRDYLIRAYIQEGLWKEAEIELKIFKEYAPIRDYYFLNGFRLRKMDSAKAALAEFHLAEQAGRRGSSLHREIASCYFLIGDIENAKRYVADGLRIKENRFLVDLKIQIAIAEKQENDARSGLIQLETIDSEAFVWHRRSTVELRFGTCKEALRAAEKANSTVEGRSPFGILAQLATCQIRERLYTDADTTIQKLNRFYSNQRSDIRLGLECRLEIERGRYTKALSLISKMESANTPVYLSMKRDALTGMLDTAIADVDRKAYTTELSQLNKQLTDFDDTGAWLTLLQVFIK